MHYRLTEFSAPVRHLISFNEDYECIAKLYLRDIKLILMKKPIYDQICRCCYRWCPSRTILEGLPTILSNLLFCKASLDPRSFLFHGNIFG